MYCEFESGLRWGSGVGNEKPVCSVERADCDVIVVVGWLSIVCVYPWCSC